MRPERRVVRTPASVQLLLTRKCNLECFYCGAEQFNQKETDPELTTEEWIQILHRLKEIKVFEINFSGGEIFTRIDIFAILETAARLKFPKMLINTNGTLIQEEEAKKLQALGFKKISISMDGDLDVHEEIRGKGSFAKTLAGIKHLVNNGIIPSIQFSPIKMNYKRLENLVEILAPLGIRSISFNRMHPSGRCRSSYQEILMDCFTDSPEFFRIVTELQEKYTSIKFDKIPLVYQNYPKVYQDLEGKLDLAQRLDLKSCSAGHASCNITSSGGVIPCSELPDFNGGSIRERDFLDIWQNSEQLAKIREVSNCTVDDIPYCQDCTYKSFCNVGCRANAYAIFGKLLAPDPFCPYWENIKKT